MHNYRPPIRRVQGNTESPEVLEVPGCKVLELARNSPGLRENSLMPRKVNHIAVHRTIPYVPIYWYEHGYKVKLRFMGRTRCNFSSKM